MGPIASKLIARLGGNKRTVLITCIVQIIAIAGLSLPLHLAGATWALPMAMTAVILINSIGAIGGPAWISWMGGVVPRSVRGRYTSNRAQIFHGMRLTSALVFMLIMRSWPPAMSWVGLQILIVVAILSRIASMLLIAKSTEPPRRPSAPASKTAKLAAQEARDFVTFLRRMHKTDLGRWTMVWATLHFGVMLAGPYFQVYWLDSQAAGGLGLADDPVRYTLLVYTSTVIRLFAFPIVGRLCDRFGATAMLRVAVAGIAMVPTGWALTTWFPALIMVEFLSGAAWCIAECSVGMLLFSCSSDAQDRSRLIGYHQTVCAVAIVIATLIGGQLLHMLPTFLGSHFRAVCLASAAMRLTALLLAIRYLPALPDEGRLRGFWRYVPGLLPTVTLTRGVFRGFRRPDAAMPLPPEPRDAP
jgi:MFS family permease